MPPQTRLCLRPAGRGPPGLAHQHGPSWDSYSKLLVGAYTGCFHCTLSVAGVFVEQLVRDVIAFKDERMQKSGRTDEVSR